jgi:ABC-type transport system involved in cytochrome bd biosynthesis fused ATPase/permease subunit
MIDLLRGHAQRAHARLSLFVLKWIGAPLGAGFLISALLGNGPLAQALGVMAGLGIFAALAWRKVQQWRAPTTASDDLPNVHEAVALGKWMQKPSYSAEGAIAQAIKESLVFVGLGWRKTRKGRARDQAVCLTPDQMRKNHIAVMGASGTGKTVAVTALLAQA